MNHPAVAAVVECELCGSAICETCDFDFSGHHACPACAVAEKEKPPEGMKPMLLSAYVLAAVTSLILLVVMLSGESWDENLAGCVFSLMLVASIAGTVLSVSAKGRARRRSLADKVAIAWNFAVLLTLGLFTVLGLMMES